MNEVQFHENHNYNDYPKNCRIINGISLAFWIMKGREKFRHEKVSVNLKYKTFHPFLEMNYMSTCTKRLKNQSNLLRNIPKMKNHYVFGV